MCNSFCIIAVLIVCLHVNKADCHQVISAYKCVPSKDSFVKLTDVSVTECVNACVGRHKCSSIGYRKQMNFCELHKEPISASDGTEDGSCIFIERKDMDTTDADTCGCTHIGHVCNPKTRQCEIAECGQLDLSNGKVYGNRHYIGAKRGVTCDKGFIERTGTKEVVCNGTGEWDPTPLCDTIDIASAPPPPTSTAAGSNSSTTSTTITAASATTVLPTTTPPSTQGNNPTNATTTPEASVTTVTTTTISGAPPPPPPPPPPPSPTNTAPWDTLANVTNIEPTTSSGNQEPGNPDSSTFSLQYYCPNMPLPIYTYFDLHNDGVRIENRTSIIFATRGKNDAHILLQKDRNDYTNNVVEIVLGGFGNTKSVIRRNVSQNIYLTEYMGSVLDPNSYQSFWISWNNGCVAVGKGSNVGVNTLMNACGIYFNITGMRISYGYGSDGYFKFDFVRSVTYLGCYEDRQTRLLEEFFRDDVSMTTTMCFEHCTSQGKRFFLTEAGSQCFCGNVSKNYEKKSESECNSVCAGNTSEMCGGDWRGSLYDSMTLEWCPNGWLHYGESCYYFSTAKKTWQDAKMECQNLISNLVEVDDSSENSFLVENAKQRQVSGFWIGLSDQESEGNFIWTGSQRPLQNGEFSDWYPGQPDNGNDMEDCTHIYHPMDFKWNDVSCTDVYHFVCEK